MPEMYVLLVENDNNSHGLIVPFISLLLIWKKRNKIDLKNIKKTGLGLVVLIVSLMLYIIGYAGGFEILPRLTIVTTLIGLVIYNLGLNNFIVIAFPLCFLFFMVPIPVSIVGIVSFPLQLIVTKLSSILINSLSIPVFRSGNMLYFTEASLEVVEACSGIRSLVAYLMIGVLFSHIMNGSLKRKSIIIFSAIPLAFTVNLFRVTFSGVLAHIFGGNIARGFLHEFSGISIFILGFVILCFFYYLLEKSSKVKDTF
jgi:exosortase